MIRPGSHSGISEGILFALMVPIIGSGSHQKRLIRPDSYWALKWGKQMMFFRLPTDVAELG